MVDIFSGLKKEEREALAELWEKSSEKERKAFVEMASLIISIAGKEGEEIVKESVEIGLEEGGTLSDFIGYAIMVVKSKIAGGKKMDKLLASLEAYKKRMEGKLWKE